MRKKEREQLVKAKKDIQNAMRSEKGLPPLSEEDNDDEDIMLVDNEEDDETAVDILLEETAHILNDLITPPSNDNLTFVH